MCKELTLLKSKTLLNIFLVHVSWKGKLELLKTSSSFYWFAIGFPIMLLLTPILNFVEDYFSPSILWKVTIGSMIIGLVLVVIGMVNLNNYLRERKMKSLASWYESQLYEAYKDARDKVDFLKLDVDIIMSESFPNPGGDFFERNKLPLLITAYFGPIWVAYVNILKSEVLIQLLLYPVPLLLLYLYFSGIIHSIRTSEKESFKSWLLRCVEHDLAKNK